MSIPRKLRALPLAVAALMAPFAFAVSLESTDMSHPSELPDVARTDQMVSRADAHAPSSAVNALPGYRLPDVSALMFVGMLLVGLSIAVRKVIVRTDPQRPVAGPLDSNATPRL